MSTSVKEILAPLDPYWDRIIRQPLTQEAVDDLEQQVGLPVPTPLRDFLMSVGLFQDLTSWKVSPIAVYDRRSQFIDTRRYLCKFLPAKYQNLFPFGDDGAGNVFALPSETDGPWRIHFVDHETRKVSRRKEFEVWLQSVVKKVLRGIRRRVPNEFKVWSVQFCFHNTSFEELAGVLESTGSFTQIDTDWNNFNTSSAGVTSSDRLVELEGEEIRIGRLEYSGWDGPILSFNLREPLADGLEHSRIRGFDTLFKEQFAGYGFVDYGPLDARELK